MIPIYLSLHNFLSYSDMEQPLDFTSFHVACISGNNGNGKSSLLDAMTWALFGRGRGVKANGAGMDNLVREGAENMEVEFTFEMEGNIFKIIRKRDKRHRQSSLDLFIGNQEHTFKNITGENITDTQHKIEKILKIDYDTFIQSVFLLQGQADLFTQQTPRERKQVLSDILGLNIYDEYSKKAKDKRNEVLQSIEMIKKEMAQIQEMIAQKETYNQALQEKTCELNKIEKTRLDIDIKLKNIYEKQVHQSRAQEELTRLRQDIQKYSLKLSKNESNLLIVNQAIKDEGETLSSREEIERSYKQLGELKEVEQKLSNKFFAYTHKQERLNQLQQVIKEEENTIKNQLAVLEAKINEWESQVIDAEKAGQQIEKLERQLKKIGEDEKEKERLEKRLQQFDAAYTASAEQMKILEKQREELRNKYRVLNTEDRCPLCRTSLTRQARVSVLKEYEQEGKSISETINKMQQVVTKLPAQMSEIREKLKIIAGFIQKKSAYEVQLAKFKDQLAQNEKLKQKTSQLKGERNEWQHKFQKRDFAREAHQGLAQVQIAIKELGYDPLKHRQLQQRIQTLLPYDEKQRRLEKASLLLQSHQRQLTELQEQEKEYQQAIVNIQNQMKVLKGLIDEKLDGEARKVEQHNQEIKQQQQQLAEEKGVLLANLKMIAVKEHEIKEKQEHFKKLNHRYEVLNQLVTACGKNGIQAIIIENALPELEIEANRLLGEMTDGRLALQLVTQRKARSKESMLETLDIYISDEMGTRNYELYSGGEAFRISFSLRVALSKVLARRAGAKLQTLVIDEGFGSQDVIGRDHLIEAIRTVQAHFAKVLVITHIQELKESFDVQLVVEKYASGSVVRIQGS